MLEIHNVDGVRVEAVVASPVVEAVGVVEEAVIVEEEAPEVVSEEESDTADIETLTEEEIDAMAAVSEEADEII